MWANLNTLERVGVLCMLLGSIVDMVQFLWLIKNWLSRLKASIYERAKKEVLLDELNRRNLDHNKPDKT